MTSKAKGGHNPFGVDCLVVSGTQGSGEPWADDATPLGLWLENDKRWSGILAKRAGATGIEGDQLEDVAEEIGAEAEVVASVEVGQHVKLTQVMLSDVTDRHNELVQERAWLLHPSERELALTGNLFVVEDLADGSGTVLVKKAPLPHARPLPVETDLTVTPQKPGGFRVDVLDRKDATEAAWEVLSYEGGVVGRTKVLHDWQQSHRPSSESHRTPRFISNTWGDRSRDSRIQESFMMDEIDAAHRMGVDVVQIDDGWEQGVTSNSSLAKEKGGVWEGFWNSDPDFWKPHPERFPNGIQGIVDSAQSKGMNIGLWFGPDSWDDFANWQRDADTILGFHRTYGIEHIKIDGVKARTQASIDNLRKFFKTVLDGSDGNVIFDLDVTAEIRPGYFGAMDVGPLFVENRYTDFHNYWPHQTLRNLWQLSRWIDPRRLRMEFLNHARNQDLYPNDPLAPLKYDPATLFATVMFSNPLGWFEVSNLPDGYTESVWGLVDVWKAHREALFSGTIVPIGGAPDGHAFTGFASLDEEGGSGFAVVFRERNSQASASLEVPGLTHSGSWEILSTNGSGEMTSDVGSLTVEINEPFGYVFGRFGRG